jgi:hypothetical protein
MTFTPLTLTTKALALAAVAAVLILTVPGLAFAVTGDTAGTGAPSRDWLERYAAAHPYGQGTPYIGTSVVSDGRSADTRDAAIAVHRGSANVPDVFERYATAHPYGQGTPYIGTSVIRDGRSPDTLDAVTSAHQIDVVSAGGFDWTDAGIGAALGAGAMIALSFGLLAWLFLRRRHQTPAI